MNKAFFIVVLPMLLASSVMSKSQNGEKLFRDWDANDDGMLSIDELPQNAKGNFGKVDVNKDSRISLAEHLSNNGAVMYSAYWCPHCHDQKEMFGQEGVKKLKVIECAEDGKNNQRELCQAKGIEGYPSWEINGEIYSGVISLKELANISDFKY